MIRLIACACLLGLLQGAPRMEPIRLHPENPHYFLFRGKPAVLITSGEHYGAVLNGDFDFRPYLDELQARGFNLTRTFSGVYRELPGTFNIVGDGVLPLSTVIKLAGRFAIPIPHPLAESVTALAWVAQIAEAPASFLKYLRFLCVADGRKARERMGFRPAYTTREAPSYL